MVGLTWGSCQPKGDSSDADITGTYVSEYSYKVIRPNTGQELGLRTIRDSIFIYADGNRYRIENRKWSSNDYDDDGWRSRLHSDNRPIPTYTAQFNHDKMSFIDPNHLPLFIDPIGRCLHVGQSGVCYSKVK